MAVEVMTARRMTWMSTRISTRSSDVGMATCYCTQVGGNQSRMLITIGAWCCVGCNGKRTAPFLVSTPNPTPNPASQGKHA